MMAVLVHSSCRVEFWFQSAAALVNWQSVVDFSTDGRLLHVVPYEIFTQLQLRQKFV